MTTLNTGKFQELFINIKKLKKQYNVPGLAVGILSEGRSMTYCEGITHIDNPLPVDEDTLFQIGSITKTFTALVLIILIERGLLELDTPIHEVLHDFHMEDERVTKHATVHHLITHTGGWEGDCYICPDKGEDSHKEFLEQICKLHQITPLGEIWAYNTMGFCIAGRMIEVLTGQSYEQAVYNLVLNPLGMHDSTFEAGKAMLKRFVVGHNYNKDGYNEVTDPWELPRALRPGGGLVCSLNDMLKYASFLLEPEHFGGTLCDPKTINSMFEHQYEASGKADAVGLSWMLKYNKNIKIIRHGGGTFGQWSELMFIPDYKFAIVLLTNSDSGLSLIEEASNLCLKQYLDISFEKPVPITVDKDSLRAYEGIYIGAGNDIDVIAEENGLLIKYNYKPFIEGQKLVPPSPPPMHAFIYKENRAIIKENNIMCDFFKDKSGDITYLRHGNKVQVKEK